jgi:hypothetical protein
MIFNLYLVLFLSYRATSEEEDTMDEENHNKEKLQLEKDSLESTEYQSKIRDYFGNHLLLSNSRENHNHTIYLIGNLI